MSTKNQEKFSKKDHLKKKNQLKLRIFQEEKIALIVIN